MVAGQAEQLAYGMDNCRRHHQVPVPQMLYKPLVRRREDDDRDAIGCRGIDIAALISTQAAGYIAVGQRDGEAVEKIDGDHQRDAEHKQATVMWKRR